MKPAQIGKEIQRLTKAQSPLIRVGPEPFNGDVQRAGDDDDDETKELYFNGIYQQGLKIVKNLEGMQK